MRPATSTHGIKPESSQPPSACCPLFGRGLLPPGRGRRSLVVLVEKPEPGADRTRPARLNGSGMRAGTRQLTFGAK